jgi:Carboxypeptidase regulatory-like domain/TonB-dependent Receptor Plug Domain
MRVALHLALAAFACAPVAAEEAASLVTLRGRVVDAQTGEPIAKALVSIRDRKVEAVTDAGGRFSLAGLPPGDAEITVATVGYGLARRTVRASADMRELEIRLGQDALKRSEEVAVIAAPFEPSDPAAPTEQQLEGTELRNLANVLTDDPLRSVQSLPGITTGDDFGATFATRGSGFTSLGFYVDGVLMNAPFHTIRDDMNGSFSLTLLNGDVVESVSLVNGGAPARYGDRIGSVLSVRTRDGSREEFSGRASLGTSGLYATLEGPIGAAKTTSWLVSARKSYLDYVLERIGQNGDIALGYYDVTAKLARSLTATQTLSLGLLHGQSRWRSTEPNLDPSDLYTADAGTDLATLRWRLFPSSSSWLETVAFFSRETGNNRSLEGTARFESGSSQWGLRSDATHALGRHRLQVGFLLRSLAEDVVSRDFDHAGASYRVTESYDASSAQVGAYLQDTWTGFDEHLTLTVGGRAERFSESGETRVEPRASLTWALSSQTRVLGAVGEYSQFPSFESLFGRQGNPELRAERSRHYVLSVEQGLGKNTRVRLEGYDQEHTGLLFAEDTEWRLEGRRRPPAPERTAAERALGSLAGDRAPPAAPQRQRSLRLGRLQLRSRSAARRGGGAQLRQRLRPAAHGDLVRELPARSHLEPEHEVPLRKRVPRPGLLSGPSGRRLPRPRPQPISAGRLCPLGPARQPGIPLRPLEADALRGGHQPAEPHPHALRRSRRHQPDHGPHLPG